ncbi:MAG: membrane integrity-associated transporter subunit PqiC [Gammaproteobacteria bacterium]
MRQAILRFGVVIGLSMMLVMACARTEPARFYLLYPLAGLESEFAPLAARPSIDVGTAAIGIDTIKLAAYLDRPEIATRQGLYRVQFAEFDRWAEPLADNIARVLAENLAVVLRSQAIHLFPWAPGARLQYRLSVDVVRFDSEPGEGALLRVHWTLRDEHERKIVISRQADYREPLVEGSYESIAAVNSRLLAHLSDDIAAAIARLSSRIEE